MASFVGKRTEFRRYIGPHLRNLIQDMTRRPKAAAGGCQECGGRGELHAAHVHGRDRNQIIDLVLDGYAGNNELVTVDLARFEERFKEEHQPLDKSFRFLCQRCHLEYDLSGQKANGGALKDYVSSTVSQGRTYPGLESGRLAKETDQRRDLAGMSPEERQVVITRVREWAGKPHLNVHRIIGIVVRRGTVSRYQLVAEIDRVTRSRNAYGAIASLLTTKGNAYGRVFEDVNGTIRLHPAVEQEVLSHRWS